MQKILPIRFWYNLIEAAGMIVTQLITFGNQQLESPMKCQCQIIYYSLSDATYPNTREQKNHLGHNLKVLCEGRHEQGCSKIDTVDAVKIKSNWVFWGWKSWRGQVGYAITGAALAVQGGWLCGGDVEGWIWGKYKNLRKKINQKILLKKLSLYPPPYNSIYQVKTLYPEIKLKLAPQFLPPLMYLIFRLFTQDTTFSDDSPCLSYWQCMSCHIEL